MWNWYYNILDQLNRIETNQNRVIDLLHLVLNREGNIMSALTDLQAALAALSTAVSSATAEIETLLTKITAPGTSDADVEAAVAQIGTLVTAIQTEVAKAQAATP